MASTVETLIKTASKAAVNQQAAIAATQANVAAANVKRAAKAAQQPAQGQGASGGAS